jgi:hypothetical protein
VATPERVEVPAWGYHSRVRLLAVLLGAGLLAAGAAAAGPTVRDTPAGAAAARISLLSTTDLGKGWTTVGKAGTSGLQVDCPGWEPSEKGIVQTGSASSPDFTGGTSGPFIVQLTSVYASAAEASALWSRAVKPGLIRCIAQTLDSITAKGIKVKILSQGPLAVQKVGAMSAAYRVVADLTSTKTGRRLKTYFDVLLVGHGKTLSEITLSTFGGAVPSKVEYALAFVVYRRISLPIA